MADLSAPSHITLDDYLQTAPRSEDGGITFRIHDEQIVAVLEYVFSSCGQAGGSAPEAVTLGLANHPDRGHEYSFTVHP